MNISRFSTTYIHTKPLSVKPVHLTNTNKNILFQYCIFINSYNYLYNITILFPYILIIQKHSDTPLYLLHFFNILDFELTRHSSVAP